MVLGRRRRSCRSDLGLLVLRPWLDDTYLGPFFATVQMIALCCRVYRVVLDETKSERRGINKQPKLAGQPSVGGPRQGLVASFCRLHAPSLASLRTSLLDFFSSWSSYLHLDLDNHKIALASTGAHRYPTAPSHLFLFTVDRQLYHVRAPA